MRWMLVSVGSSLGLLAACGGSSHPAQSPSNAETSASPTSSEGEQKSDDTGKKVAPENPPGAAESATHSPCSGAEIANLTSVLAQSICEAKEAKPETRDLTDSLEVKAQLDSKKVAPGDKATVTVTYHNKGTQDLPLYFIVDPEPRFEVEVHTKKGGRIDQPAGREPALPHDVASAAPPEKTVAMVTIAPQGTATASVAWQAVRHRWASKDEAKGAAAGHGYPQQPAGPLPTGKFVLHVVTPLIGVTEGTDHKFTQPRVDVLIAP